MTTITGSAPLLSVNLYTFLTSSSLGATSETQFVRNSTWLFAIEFTGTGLANYADGWPSSGTITGIIQRTTLGAVVATYSDLSFPAAALSAAFAAGNSNSFTDFTRLILGGNDTITGSNVPDPFAQNAGGPNGDYLSGYDGDDVINGRAGPDVLQGDAGNDNLNGGDDRDSLDGGAGNDILNGDGGNDQLFSYEGIDVLDGGAGYDTAQFRRVDATQNFLIDAAAVLTAQGLVLPDGNIIRNVETALIATGSGNDTFFFLQPITTFHTLNGGAGADRLILDASTQSQPTFLRQNTVGGVPGRILFAGQTAFTPPVGRIDLIDFEIVEIRGSDFDDSWFGDSIDEFLYANGGNDFVRGDGGADFIDGGSGHDTLLGGEGDDTLSGNTGNDTLTGGAGADIFIAIANGGTDTISDFSVAQDRINLASLTSAQKQAAIASARNSGGDTLIDIAGGTFVLTGIAAASLTSANFILDAAPPANLIVVGTSGADTLIGGLGNDLLDGGGGDDVQYGGAGTNVLIGGSGNDVLVSESTSDSLSGGDGNDTYILNAGGSSVAESGTTTGDIVYTFGNMTLPHGVEAGVLFGNAANLSGNALANLLIGNSANNTLTGGDGDDTIYGVGGTNAILGEGGNDVLVSGTGTDVLSGGSGDDVYIIQAGDVLLENAGGGRDTVYVVSGNFLMDVSADIEVVAAIGASSLTGNGLNNTLIGDGGDNALNGGGGDDFLIGGGGSDLLFGGAGLDTMQGHGGADTYAYRSTSEFGDIIQDWINTEDQFLFLASAFGFVAGQALVEGTNFFAATAPAATGTGPSFLWDTDDTALYFDADGAGAGAAVLLVDLQAFTTVTVSDFTFSASAEAQDGKDTPVMENLLRDEFAFDAPPMLEWFSPPWAEIQA